MSGALFYGERWGKKVQVSGLQSLIDKTEEIVDALGADPRFADYLEDGGSLDEVRGSLFSAMDWEEEEYRATASRRPISAPLT